MYLTAVKEKVATVASGSMLPPLCQILKDLCYNPTCCTVYKGLLQTNTVSALAVREIKMNLFMCSMLLRC